MAKKKSAKATKTKKTVPKKAVSAKPKVKARSLSAATAAAAMSSTMTPPPPDPFDLESLAIPGDIATSAVKKAVTTVPVRKPHRQEFVRVHPVLRGAVAVITDKNDSNAEYLLTGRAFIQSASEALPGEVVGKMLYLTVSRQGTLFLWPVRLQNTDGRAENDWNRSAREAAMMAVDVWVRVASNRSLGAYEPFVAAGIQTEPSWPDEAMTWKELLRIAFKSRLIADFNHPLVRDLTGE